MPDRARREKARLEKAAQEVAVAHAPQGKPDAGTFLATTPEQGGFLLPDGTPVPVAEPFVDPAQEVLNLPIDTEYRESRHLPFALKLLIIFVIAVSTVALLVYWLISYNHSADMNVIDDYSQLIPQSYR